MMERQAFRAVFSLESVHMMAEFFVMLGSLLLAGFLLLRHGSLRTGMHFWTACALLVQGDMVGFHIMNMGKPIGPLMQMTAHALTGLVAVLVFTRPLAQTRRLHGIIPSVIIWATTALGLVMMKRPEMFLGTWDFQTGATGLNPILLVSVAAFLGAAGRVAYSAYTQRSITALWVTLHFVMLAGAALAYNSSPGIDDGWLFHLLRGSSMMILLLYVVASTSREFLVVDSFEKELRSSEARYKALTENTSDIIFILGPQDIFTYVSPAAARIAGVREKDLIGHRPGTFTHADDVPKVREGIAEARSRPGQSIRVGTIRVRKSDQSWLHVEGIYTSLDHDPVVAGTVLNYRDVTDHQLSMRELDESQERNKRLVQNLQGMVYRCRLDGDYTVEYVSDYCQVISGYKAEEYLDGHSVRNTDVIHPNDLASVRRAIRAALDEGVPYQVEYRINHRDGGVRWVMERGSGVRSSNGEYEAVEGIIVDITDIVNSRTELRRTKFSVDNAMDALYWFDREGHIIDCNDTASHYLGYSRDAMLSMTIFDISADLRKENWGTVWEHVREEGAVLVEGVHMTNTGRQIPVEVSSIFISYEGEEYHCCFVRDITERKEVERQIQKLNQDLEKRVLDRTAALQEAQEKLVTSEKMAALGNLVAGVAHEINTPLGIGITAASHMESKVKECCSLYESGKMRKSDFEKFLGLASETSGLLLTNLQRAASLIHGFKQVSVDQSSEERRTFQLDEYMNDVVNSLKPELARYGHVIELSCLQSMSVDSYPGAVAQIMTNLIMNSVKHGFDENRDGKIWINVDGDDDRVRILYKDDGKGMAREQLRRLYDPFYTTKRGRGGSGLGMNIVFNLVTQLLKGTIECQSDLGQGVVFLLDYPRQTPLNVRAIEQQPIPEMV